MQISINGEFRETSPVTVSQLLDTLGINPGRVAVELNREILPKGDYAVRMVADGDKFEIVHFVGGG